MASRTRSHRAKALRSKPAQIKAPRRPAATKRRLAPSLAAASLRATRSAPIESACAPTACVSFKCGCRIRARRVREAGALAASPSPSQTQQRTRRSLIRFPGGIPKRLLRSQDPSLGSLVARTGDAALKRGEIWTVSGGAEFAGKPRPAVVLQQRQLLMPHPPLPFVPLLASRRSEIVHARFTSSPSVRQRPGDPFRRQWSTRFRRSEIQARAGALDVS